MITLLKKIKNFLFPSKIELRFFIFKGPGLSLSDPLHVAIIDSWQEFCSTPRIPNSLKNEISEQRFERHDRFVYLANAKEILSWGWIFGGKSFYLFETGKTSCHEDNTFVYDFFTPEKHRNHSYYTILLSNIPSLLGTSKVTIGAASKNVASIRGIQKAGFIPYDMKFCDDRRIFQKFPESEKL